MKYSLTALFLGLLTQLQAQTLFVQDNFEGGGTISTWFGDACAMNNAFANPFVSGSNLSATVLRYHDTGGQYANVRFQVPATFDLSQNATFSLKIYVPSSGLTGSQPNQVSLKLQNGDLGSPWVTQSEIIKPVVLNQWQTVTFNFASDPFINLDPGSPPPTTRNDFNRIVIQVNGENNFDHVLAYLDDVNFDALDIPVDPVFDQLVWSDEFSVDGVIDPSKWFHQTQLPTPTGWYNGEIQHYTNRLDNAEVSGGTLKVRAKKETFFDQGVTKQYTSARLNSKFAFTYGRVEVRAKLPSGVGTWPAIWMLGKNINENGSYWDNEGYGTTPWPDCGEIDIMEHWGSNPNYVSSATHTPSSFGGTINVGGQTIPSAMTGFHIYSLTWTPDALVFAVDGVTHFTYNPEVKDASTWPFNQEQFMLLNLAILPEIAPSFTSGAMEVDYVRVYQQSECPAPTGLTTNVLSTTAATLSWNPVSNALGYRVTGGPVGGPSKNFRTAATSRTIPILNPSTNYQWLVSAYCDPEFSNPSPTQFFSTPAARTLNPMLLVPNPSSGSVQVTLPDAGEWTVEVIDIKGRILQSTILSGQQTLLVSSLSSGLYIVRVSGSDIRMQELLVIQ
ncbi:MAG: family 16 glycosylhydrolase [Bacteroidetes bacterium]|nr:family 16 glycosylhydrolase [Bacteroidota bacterium]